MTLNEAEARGRSEIRISVRNFARQMEERLQQNDWKGGWQDDAAGDLFNHLVEEVGEIAELLRDPKAIYDDVLGECADAANMAMMVAEQFSTPLRSGS